MTADRHCALAIEAATEQFGVAACRGGRVAHWQARPARDETQRVYQHAERVLAEVDATFADLDFVAFGCGPGSFTGVRIAAAAAQSIAFARSLPVCRISSLAVLAAGAGCAAGAELVATCLDARMERAYIALYRVVPGAAVAAVVADALIEPGKFALPGAERFLAAGDGWRAYPDLLARHAGRISGIDETSLPSSADLLQLAADDYRRGRTVSAYEALPEYLGQGPQWRASENNLA